MRNLENPPDTHDGKSKKMNSKSFKFLFLFLTPLLILGVLAFLLKFLFFDKQLGLVTKVIDKETALRTQRYKVKAKIGNDTLDALLIIKANVAFSAAKEMCKKLNMR